MPGLKPAQPTLPGARLQPGVPASPPAGQARLSFLTAQGLSFGQAPLQALATDPLAGPVLMAGTALMAKLVEMAQ